MCRRRKLDSTDALIEEARAVPGLDVDQAPARARLARDRRGVRRRSRPRRRRAGRASRAPGRRRVKLPSLEFRRRRRRGPRGVRLHRLRVAGGGGDRRRGVAGAGRGARRRSRTRSRRCSASMATAEVAAVCDLPGPRAPARAVAARDRVARPARPSRDRRAVDASSRSAGPARRRSPSTPTLSVECAISSQSATESHMARQRRRASVDGLDARSTSAERPRRSACVGAERSAASASVARPLAGGRQTAAAPAGARSRSPARSGRARRAAASCRARAAWISRVEAERRDERRAGAGGERQPRLPPAARGGRSRTPFSRVAPAITGSATWRERRLASTRREAPHPRRGQRGAVARDAGDQRARLRHPEPQRVDRAGLSMRAAPGASGRPAPSRPRRRSARPRPSAGVPRWRSIGRSNR